MMTQEQLTVVYWLLGVLFVLSQVLFTAGVWTFRIPVYRLGGEKFFAAVFLVVVMLTVAFIHFRSVLGIVEETETLYSVWLVSWGLFSFGHFFLTLLASEKRPWVESPEE